MTDTPKVGFVGAGMVAELHEQAVRTARALTLCGVYDTDQTVSRARATAWDTHAYPTLEAMLEDERLDALLILTPEATHEELATRAMNAGKHVLVEKPVGTPDAVARLEATAASAGRVCLPGHNYAYQPEFVELRRLVRGGDLGHIRAAWITYIIRHPEEVAAHYGGVLEEIMVHHSYLTLALFGPPQTVHAGRAEPAWQHHAADDQAWMTWLYPGGLSAHLFASFAVDDETLDPWMFQVKVLGDNGGSTYNWRSSLYRRPLGSLPYALPAYESSYAHEHVAFAQAIAGGQPVSPLADARAAATIIEAAVDISSAPDYGARIRI